MSDVSSLVLVAVAALLLLVAYAVFQFRRQCQEHHRRKCEGDNTAGRPVVPLGEGWTGTPPAHRL